MEMLFSVGTSVNFRFDVGAPSPQPSAWLGYLDGTFMAVYDGTIKNNTQESVLYGTFTEEE